MYRDEKRSVSGSPMLFNIIIEELSEKLTETRIEALIYADGIVVVGEDEQIKEAIKIIKSWCLKSNMTIGKDKCGI